MARDWSHGALDDLIQSGAFKPGAEPRFRAEELPRRDVRLGLAGLSLLVGAMAALLYAWPVLLVTTILAGMRGTTFWAILGSSAAVAAIAVWTVTKREEHHWAENWQDVGDWADPPPWK